MPDTNDFKIQPDALDVEWLQQADLHHECAVRLRRCELELADAKNAYEEAKNNVEEIEAELQIAIRKDPDSVGLPKITDAVVAAAVKNEPDYHKAKTHQTKTKHEMNVLQVECSSLERELKSFDHKRKALENLVQLHGQDYFSEPRVYTREGHEGVEEIQKRSVRTRGRRRRQEREDDDD